MSHTKQDVREHVWQALVKARVHRFPGTRGRIPNFVGAERAADRLSELDMWKRAKVLKCNPGAAQCALSTHASGMPCEGGVRELCYTRSRL